MTHYDSYYAKIKLVSIISKICEVQICKRDRIIKGFIKL